MEWNEGMNGTTEGMMKNGMEWKEWNGIMEWNGREWKNELERTENQSKVIQQTPFE